MGAGLYKLRIATKEGRGKSGGSRSILAFKNDKGNVTTSELKKLKHLVDIIFALTDEQISKLINLREFCEVSTKV